MNKTQKGISVVYLNLIFSFLHNMNKISHHGEILSVSLRLRIKYQYSKPILYLKIRRDFQQNVAFSRNALPSLSRQFLLNILSDHLYSYFSN